MNFRQFLATRQAFDDLRTLPDCVYSPANGDWTEPVKGFAYCGSYALEALPEGKGFRVMLPFETDYPDLASAEFALFYWYGRDSGPGPSEPLSLFDRMEMACRSSRLDDACRFIQDGLGVEAGDRASVFFSYAEGTDGPNDSNWTDAGYRKRFEWMRDYISAELRDVEARLLEGDGARFEPQIMTLLRANGFEPYHTGGGCMSMALSDARGQILVTDQDLGFPTDDAWLIGAYPESPEMGQEDPVFMAETGQMEMGEAIRRAIAAFQAIPVPQIDCGQCEGAGETDAMGDDEECPVCDGSGRIKRETAI